MTIRYMRCSRHKLLQIYIIKRLGLTLCTDVATIYYCYPYHYYLLKIMHRQYSEMERPVPSLIATLDQIERTRPIDISSRPLPIHATTEERLDAWARAPGPDMELGTFNQYNFEQCSHVEPNYNYDLFKKGE